MKIEEAIEILELPAQATFDDARRAYRELIQIWHSDRYQHSAQLLQRAQGKTRVLNEAWEAISALGEEGFEAFMRRAAKQQPERGSRENQEKEAPPLRRQARADIKLREFRPTGMVMVPIWKRASRVNYRTGAICLLSVILIAAGIFRFKRFAEDVQLLLTGVSDAAQIELCGEDGRGARIRVVAGVVFRDIPHRHLSLSMDKQGVLHASCPGSLAALYLSSDPRIMRIGGEVRDLWWHVVIQLVGFVLAPLYLLYKTFG